MNTHVLPQKNRLSLLEVFDNELESTRLQKLWTDLSSSPEHSPPAWHGDELARRRNAAEEGRETYTDWNKAKDETRKAVKLTVSGLKKV